MSTLSNTYRPTLKDLIASADMGEVHAFTCVTCGEEEKRVANPNIPHSMDNLKLCNSCHAENVDAMARERSKKQRLRKKATLCKLELAENLPKK